MVALARDMADPGHPATACLVLSNRPDAAGLRRAAELGIPTACIDHRSFGGDRAAFETAMAGPLKACGAEIICLAGFMRVLTPGFIRAWEGRMINIHPSILPLFPGLDTHARCLAAGMAVHGCSVHEVTTDLDAGPILGQAVMPVEAGDTAASLAARLLPLEHRLYPAVLRRFARGDKIQVALLAPSATSAEPGTRNILTDGLTGEGA